MWIPKGVRHLRAPYNQRSLCRADQHTLRQGPFIILQLLPKEKCNHPLQLQNKNPSKKGLVYGITEIK